MTKMQEQILEMIGRLSMAERRELLERLQNPDWTDESFYDRMMPEQRAHLDEGIAQANRGEGEEAPVVFDRLAKRLGVTRARRSSSPRGPRPISSISTRGVSSDMARRLPTKHSPASGNS
jgi:hypothetical protein